MTTDNTTSGYSAGTLSTNFTTSGLGRLMVFSALTSSTTAPTVTYGGVSLTRTRVISDISGASNNSLHVYILVNPALGINTFTCNATDFAYHIHTYNLSRQTGQPDSITSTAYDVAASHVYSLTNNFDTNRGFLVIAHASATSSTPSGYTQLGSTADALGYSLKVFNSTSTLSAGSQSVTITPSSSVRGWGIFFTLRDGAATVNTEDVTNIDFTTATGNATISDDGGSVISERGFCWNTSTGPTTSNSKVVVSGTTGSYTGSITGLTYDTHYYVRAYATTVNGTTYGDEVEFDTLAPPAGQISKDINAAQGANYAVSVNVGGTTGSVTVKLGTTGTTATFSAGSGVNTFEGTYSGVSGIIIEKSATFDGYVDDVMYLLLLTDTEIDWDEDSVTMMFPIESSVTFKRMEDKEFNRFRIYRYLDLMFKNLDGYVTVTIRQEAHDSASEKENTILVGNIGSSTSPFVKKLVSFLSKNQSLIITLSNANLDENFSIAQYQLRGTEVPRKLFSASKITSIN